MKRADVAWTVALVSGAALLYSILLQERFTADGPGLTNAYLSGAGKTYYNVLFLPFCRLVGALLPVAAERVPHVASAVAGVLAIGLCYPFLRAFTREPGRAAFATALIAVSPPMLFFSTTSELHSLHVAVVALTGCATVYGPWQRPSLALACTATLFPLLFWSHVTAVLLGPGWVLLVQWARCRRAAPFGWRTLVFVVGPVLLAGFVLGLCAANDYRGGRFIPDPTELLEWMSSAYRPPLAHRMVLHGWLLPLLVIVPASLLGLARVWRQERLLCAVVVILIAPSLAYFLIQGVPERGAYFLGSILFWTVLVMRAAPEPATRAVRVAALSMLAIQSFFGVRQVVEFDRGFRMAERTAQIRTAFGGEPHGIVLSGGDWSLNVQHELPQVEEWSVWEVIRRFMWSGLGPEEAAQAAVDSLVPVVDQTPVVADISWRALADSPSVAVSEPWLRALEAQYDERFETVLFEHSDWPMLRLLPKDGR